MKKEKEQKVKDLKKPVCISLTDKEKAKLKRKAKAADVSISSYVAYMLKGV